jgi:hypothetical protein
MIVARLDHRALLNTTEHNRATPPPAADPATLSKQSLNLIKHSVTHTLSPCAAAAGKILEPLPSKNMRASAPDPAQPQQTQPGKQLRTQPPTTLCCCCSCCWLASPQELPSCDPPRPIPAKCTQSCASKQLVAAPPHDTSTHAPVLLLACEFMHRPSASSA